MTAVAGIRAAVIERGWAAYRRAMETDWPDDDRQVARTVYDLNRALMAEDSGQAAGLILKLARILPGTVGGSRP